jgi:2-succinyl-5-enolpyruvyl-6-hydroxy-3-cyclohexene-1-carboxylate synthase
LQRKQLSDTIRTPMQEPNANYFAARLIIEEMVRLGVRAFGIAPGSRSSPLAETAASHPALEIVVHCDERGLAFHMLGRARGSGRPTAVLTTSGTAAANVFPAVAEAHHAGVPLIVITADRPPELRDCGANQATDQVKLFGAFVRRFIEMPPPDERMTPSYILAAIDDLVSAATAHPAGPVHLNCLFREPLAPVARAYPRRALLRSLGAWLSSGAPWVRAVRPHVNSAAEMPKEMLEALSAAPKGIVMAGALMPEGARAAADLAAHLGWPLLPDLQSGLRLGAAEPSVISHADLMLHSRTFAREVSAGCMLQFGGSFISRRFTDCAAAPRASARVLVDSSPRRIDPSHGAAIRAFGDPAAVARALQNALPRARSATRIQAWAEASERVERELARQFAGAEWSEPRIAWELSRLITAECAWFIGNSLPIRLVSMFASARGACVPVAASRGLSGIDGQVATAAGYAAGSRRPVTALLGDLTVLHDLNSLAFLRTAASPVVLVVINNDGGGIFSLLPIAESARHFERVFAAPHGLRFRDAARQVGLRYAAPESPAALARAWRAAARSGESALIEVRTNRADTARRIRALQSAIAHLLDRGT